LLVILAVAAPAFYTSRFGETWIDIAPVLITGIGMTLIILARHIDISIGSQFSICGVVAGLLCRGGMPMPIVVLCTLVLGALMGSLNGVLVAGMRLPSIVATLATMVILRESLRWIGQGETVTNLPDSFQWFGQTQRAGQITIVAVSLSLLLLAIWAMRWLMAGRAVYAIGSDREAARLAGIRPDRVVFAVFVLMGILTAIASVLAAIRFPQVVSNSGVGLELQTIAAVVVGGTAVAGGKGSLVGTLIGVALLGTVAAALGFLFSRPEWDKAIQGAIILIAVASDGLKRRAT
jgi:rhamnose transport system permease protein